MRSELFNCLAALAALAFCVGASPAPAAETPGLVAPLADTHMHIQSPALSEQLRALAKAHPDMFKIMDDAILAPRTGADALRQLDEAHIREGSLLSEAYMWTSPALTVAPEEAAAQTRAENAYDVEAALQSGGRLHAYIGINPLWAGALDEMRFWAGKPGVTGIKIHLANSGFNPRSPADVAKVQAVFDAARTLHLPVVIHVRHSAEYPASDAAVFIDQILPHVGDLPIQIAHGGGWGGLDQATVDALRLYGEAIARKAPGTERLQIDLTLVVIDAHTDADLAKAFAGLMRKIGLHRFVFGSDWPAKYSPAGYERLLVSQIPLSPAEWNTVFSTPSNR